MGIRRTCRRVFRFVWMNHNLLLLNVAVFICFVCWYNGSTPIHFRVWEWVIASKSTFPEIPSSSYFSRKAQEHGKLDWLNSRTKLLADPNQKQKLLLFCYMRGGSTVFSEAFRQNKEAMFWYEPLDAFYRDMFGMSTWHFPQDIAWYRHTAGNSTLRVLSEEENNEVAEYLSSLFHCNYERTSVAFLQHPQVQRTKYSKLSLKHDLFKKNCTEPISSLCSGDNIGKALRHSCPEKIKWALSSIQSNFNASKLQTGVSSQDLMFLSVAACLREERAKLSQCYHTIQQDCSRRKMVVMKVLRLQLQTIRSVIQRNPDLHVFYFVRDPRAIAASRYSQHLMFRDSFGNVVLETKYLCKRMAEDLKTFKELQMEFPQVFHMFRYEDFVLNSTAGAITVYQKLGLNVHSSVLYWYRTAGLMESYHNFSGDPYITLRSNSSAHIDKWKLSIKNVTIRERMTYYCRTVLKALNYSLTY